MKKRIFAALLSVAMLFNGTGLNVFATEEDSQGAGDLTETVEPTGS